MFEENENLVEETTENAEQLTAEENVGTEAEDILVNDTTEEESVEEPKQEMFTKEQVDKMIAKKLARKEHKLRREYEDKYSRVETVLNAGLGTSNINEATDKLTEFYTQKGISIPEKPSYSEKDIEVLAKAEAEDIISLGYDEIVEEVDRLAEIGIENMTQRDKVIFSKIASERQRIEEEKALASIGVGKDAINEQDFKDFADKLNSNLSLKEKYEMYLQFKPKKEIKQIGSMKNGAASKVKDHYSTEEIERLTLDDLDNPEVWEAVRKSMTGQN